MALAIGSALFFAGAVAVVALCRTALRQGAEAEGEIKALSLRLKFRVRPQRAVAGRPHCPDCAARGDVLAARTDSFKEK